MTKKSLSAPYGNYGGVSNDAHYVPPTAPSFVPCLPTINLYSNLNISLKNIEEVKSFVVNTSGNILMRYLDGVDPEDMKTFVMYTCDNPNDTITYKASSINFMVDMLHDDGGIF